MNKEEVLRSLRNPCEWTVLEDSIPEHLSKSTSSAKIAHAQYGQKFILYVTVHTQCGQEFVLSITGFYLNDEFIHPSDYSGLMDHCPNCKKPIEWKK